ncbi:MAG: sugar transferase [Candidatus Hydrogenedentes bacterium]|nr:sugar transferase [Candidatus Hydrogenedentota bacterium]
MSILKRHAGFLTLTLVAFDSGCALVAALIASHMVMPADGSRTLVQTLLDHRLYVLGFMVVWYLAAGDQRLFVSHRGDSLVSQLVSIIKALAVSLAVTAVLILFLSRHAVDRQFLLYFGGASAVLILGFRTILRLFLWSIRRRGYNFRQLLIIGGNPRSAHLVEVIASHGQYGYHLAGLLDDDPERAKHLEKYKIPYLGPVKELENVLLSHVIDEVYVCLPVRKYYSEITSVAHLCEGVGVSVRMFADLFPLRVATRQIYQLEDIPLLSLSTIPEAFAQLALKRAIDMAVSGLFLLAVAWWLFPIIALIIKLDSKGPVFFLQDRVGLNQRRFKCIKFRSMVVNAEELKAQLAALNEADGPVFKMRRDPRMTRVGRWIRKFSIDEMPQIVNVFLGDMSLVGPRPPVPAEVEKYTWDQRRRLSVRPGITGLQQVSGRSDVDFDDWVELDLAYIDNWSLMEDIRILFRTFQVVLQAKGAA